jgi:hypothetical protein
VPDFPLRAIQVMRVSRQPVFEILDMRKIDEAFSDSLKTPRRRLNARKTVSNLWRLLFESRFVEQLDFALNWLFSGLTLMEAT